VLVFCTCGGQACANLSFAPWECRRVCVCARRWSGALNSFHQSSYCNASHGHVAVSAANPKPLVNKDLCTRKSIQTNFRPTYWCRIPVLGTSIEFWVASVEVACKEVYRCMQNCWFPHTLLTRQPCIVWVLFWLPTKTAWHFKLPSRSKAISLSPFSKFVFTDFLAHKIFFTRGFWLAADNASTISSSRNS